MQQPLACVAAARRFALAYALASGLALAGPALATAPATSAAEHWDFRWSDGFALQRGDGAFRLSFGGRLWLDGAVIEETPGLERDLEALGGAGEGNGVEVRRARIHFDGTAYERLFFRSQLDFAGGTPAFRDVFVGLRDLGPVGSVRVGQFKEPFFLDEQNNDDFIAFMERPTTNVFYPDRNVGVMATNTLAERRVLWQLAAFRDTDDFGAAFSSFGGTDWDVTARVTGLPLWEDQGRRLVHLGAAYLHRFRGSAERYAQRPEEHLADRFVDTGPFDATDANVFDAELAWVEGPFSLQGEYTHSLVEGRAGQPDLSFWGAYAQASWFPTGEQRVYDPATGAFGRVRPRASFDPSRGGWGAFELVARTSYLDLSDDGVSGGELLDLGAGVNWYPYPNARLMLGYVHAVLSGRQADADPDPMLAVPIHVSGRAHVVQTRFQVFF